MAGRREALAAQGGPWGALEFGTVFCFPFTIVWPVPAELGSQSLPEVPEVPQGSSQCKSALCIAPNNTAAPSNRLQLWANISTAFP